MTNNLNKYTGRIYIIKSPSTEKVYIGSTIHSLSKRMSQHQNKFNYVIGSGDFSKWCASYYILEYMDSYIELISEHYNITKKELKIIEGETINNFKQNCVNINIAGRTAKQYYKDGYSKIYYQNNKSKIKEIATIFNKENKDKRKIYNRKYYLKKKNINL